MPRHIYLAYGKSFLICLKSIFIFHLSFGRCDGSLNVKDPRTRKDQATLHSKRDGERERKRVGRPHQKCHNKVGSTNLWLFPVAVLLSVANSCSVAQHQHQRPPYHRDLLKQSVSNIINTLPVNFFQFQQFFLYFFVFHFFSCRFIFPHWIIREGNCAACCRMLFVQPGCWWVANANVSQSTCGACCRPGSRMAEGCRNSCNSSCCSALGVEIKFHLQANFWLLLSFTLCSTSTTTFSSSLLPL